MKPDPQDLKVIADCTLESYDKRAQDFWEGTRHHDVGQNITALLRHIEGKPPFTILDFGCGPGRDLKTFVHLGHIAIGLEGATRFVTMARAYIFANASLFHVPSKELPRVLRELQATLKPGGVLFSSNPHGHNEEGWSGGRYGVFHDLDTWRRYLSTAGFAELMHYYRPEGLPREQQPWLASVWRSLRRA
jgi:SAM-dependent methyltransferase